jgi:hypothetical protein
MTHELGPLYTRSLARPMLVQKLKSAPRAFTLEVKAEIAQKKCFQSVPKLLIN